MTKMITTRVLGKATLTTMAMTRPASPTILVALVSFNRLTASTMTKVNKNYHY